MPIASDTESLSVLALADRLAASDIPVLINGPTGTGKEVLSRFIHTRSPRLLHPVGGPARVVVSYAQRYDFAGRPLPGPS